MCERCFAPVSEGATFCADCGAPMDASADSAADASVYPELARANLFRMRGEYKQAEEVCLAILRRLPNHASAHTLLGDISAERGDLAQAIEWYELALDLTPSSQVNKDKLASVRQRMRDHEAALTAEQIGIPQKSPNMSLFVGLTLAIMLIVGAAAYFFGRQIGEERAERPLIDVAPRPRAERTEEPPPQIQPSPQTGVGAATTRPTWHDATLTDFLVRQINDSGRILTAYQDPRTKATTVTFSFTEQENPREIAARLGSSVMEHLPSAPIVTARGIRGGRLSYVVDVPRDRVVQISSQEWQNQNADNSQAWIDYVLVNEWREESAQEPSTPPGSPGI